MNETSRTGSDAAAEAWFRAAPSHTAAELTLVCLPHAGGGASTFREWRARLPAGVQLLAVQYPGHEGRWRDPLRETVHDIARPLAGAIAARARDDFALYGHSLGALIAFEIVRILRRSGACQPRHLFVSGSRAPDMPNRRGPIHAEPDDAFVRHLMDFGGLPAEVVAHTQMMQMLMPMLRADLRMDETYIYTPEPPLDCPISAFIGTHDPEVAEDQADAWRRQTRASFVLHVLPAGHFWPPDAETEVLGRINDVLRRLAARVTYDEELSLRPQRPRLASGAEEGD